MADFAGQFVRLFLAGTLILKCTSTTLGDPGSRLNRRSTASECRRWRRLNLQTGRMYVATPAGAEKHQVGGEQD
jgi:hypothetical protein